MPLVIAGDGPQLDELRGLGGDVRFTGRVSADELTALRRDAAVAVVPSRYAEILPLAALEAMAAGLPSSPRTREASPRSCPPRASIRLATSARSPTASRLSGGRRDAGERSLAAARARFAPSVVAAALRSVYSGH